MPRDIASLCRILVGGLLLAPGLLCFGAAPRPLTVWLMPVEEAAARTYDDPSETAKDIRSFNGALAAAGGRVHVLNTLRPLDAQLIVWNSAFAVPNWSWVRNQTETVAALQRFAEARNIEVNVRFETWDRAFSDLNASRRGDPRIPPPDVVEIGTTWAANFASRGLIACPDRLQTPEHNVWKRVLGDTCVVPYISDLRLLFYWARLPGQEANSARLNVKSASWDSLLDSLRREGNNEDQIAFAGGLTLNLVMDYAMLTWAGGGNFVERSPYRTHLDLLSGNATQVPDLLARAAGGNAGIRRVVVPESSHQELTQGFVAGQYRATIEPANFIARWKQDFERTFGKRKRFWDYGDAALLPTPLKGGSYLAVMRSPDLPAAAFDLAEFLATDERFTTVLAKNGHLPVLRGGGVDVLQSWLGPENSPDARRFANTVRETELQSRMLPDIPEWPTDVESTEVLEAFQRVWRRIGDGNLIALHAELQQTQDIVNLKIDRFARIRAGLLRYVWVGGAALLGFLVFGAYSLKRTRLALAEAKHALAQATEALRREEVAIGHARTLRGFSANALLALARYHTLGIYGEVSDSPSDAKKRSIIAAGIQGWRRGRNPDNWKPSSVSDVIWRSILLAFDLVHEPDIYERWETCRKSTPSPSPREFLEGCGHLRRSPVGDEDSNRRSYFFHVICPEDYEVHTPFLLEQALASLFQNAIQASDEECGRTGPRKLITAIIGPDRITILNAGETIPKSIADLVNLHPIPSEFEKAVLRAVRSAEGRRPGIGLTEAYAIAAHCYAGLEIEADAPAITIHLRAKAENRQ